MSEVILTDVSDGEREFAVTIDGDTTTYPSKAEAMKASRHAAKGGGTVIDLSTTPGDTGQVVQP